MSALWPKGPRQWVWCVAIGLEPILRFSISIMPALPDNRLMHYSTHSTRKRELSYTTTDRALGARMELVASSGFRLVQYSFLLCRYKKGRDSDLILFAESIFYKSMTLLPCHPLQA